MLRGYFGSSTLALGLKIVPPILNEVFDGDETEKLNEDDAVVADGVSFGFGGSFSILGSVPSFSFLASISSSFFTGVSLGISLVVLVVVMVMLDTDSDDDPEAAFGDGCGCCDGAADES